MDEIEKDVDDILDDADRPISLSPEALKRRKERQEIARILLELNNTVNCLKIVREIQSTCNELHQGFLALTHRALIGDAVSSLIRVLDRHQKAFSFWAIERRFRNTVKRSYDEDHIDSNRIHDLCERLMQARRKLHFHIDKEYAANPDDLWKRLNIRHEEMFNVANDLARIVSRVLTEQYTFPLNLSLYDATDVKPILDCLHKHGLGNFVKR